MTAAAPAAGDELVRLEGVSVGYDRGAAPVLRDVNLCVARGDLVGIVGPNGSGKTTLLRTVLGILPPRAGTLRRAPGARLGYVPQRQALDPIYPLRAIDVVVMGLYGELGLLRRVGLDERRRAALALEAAGIPHLEERLYRDLSGGQQQRTLVARALVAQPDLLVLDEPTNDLDLAGERDIMELVAFLHRAGRTVLLVSHMLNVVAAYATRLAILEGGTVGEIAGRRVVVPRSATGSPGSPGPEPGA